MRTTITQFATLTLHSLALGVFVVSGIFLLLNGFGTLIKQEEHTHLSKLLTFLSEQERAQENLEEAFEAGEDDIQTILHMTHAIEEMGKRVEIEAGKYHTDISIQLAGPSPDIAQTMGDARTLTLHSLRLSRAAEELTKSETKKKKEIFEIHSQDLKDRRAKIIGSAGRL